MRCNTIAQLTRRITAESGLVVRPIISVSSSPENSGVDMHLLPVDQAIICYPSSPEKTADFVRLAQSIMPAGIRLTGGVRLMNPQTLHPSHGPAFESAYEQAGVDSTIFYNYGMAPLPMLEALAKEPR